MSADAGRPSHDPARENNDDAGAATNDIPGPATAAELAAEQGMPAAGEYDQVDELGRIADDDAELEMLGRLAVRADLRWRCGDPDCGHLQKQDEPECAACALPRGWIRVSLHVENTYELYPDVEREFTDEMIPAPPADRTGEAWNEWARVNIYDRFTGVGHTDGDSWYDVAITACSDPTLVGLTFDWGY